MIIIMKNLTAIGKKNSLGKRNGSKNGKLSSKKFGKRHGNRLKSLCGKKSKFPFGRK